MEQAPPDILLAHKSVELARGPDEVPLIILKTLFNRKL